ncbi:hypothetical protein H0G86_003728 [Trichoderma simmonsii]|uniref:Uncharacterized protein n=1 Tax=Trichoderma simmonsii TaxID=1491479 RepID=A0A8G0L664_9HYPO|nr:hypothetical protein H0G86_003728 [Trichoderma simmonsii]
MNTYANPFLSRPRCVPGVQFDYYYSTRDGETVLVREPIEQPQPRCNPRCPEHCETTTVSVSMNVSPPTEPRDRPREDAEQKRRSLKENKKRSSRHKSSRNKSSRHKKKKKSSHHRSSRSSRQCKQSFTLPFESRERKTANETLLKDTETEATSGWTADDDDNRYQVALWIGESSRTRGGENSPQEGGSGAREAAVEEDNVSSPGEEGDDETPTPGNSKKPKSTK